MTHRERPVICLDSDAAIAAFQKNPPQEIASYRDNVHYFLETKCYGARVLFPAVALAEYLWRADKAELEAEIRRVVGDMLIPAGFDQITAEIAANLGRSYAAGRKLSDVAKQVGTHRIALKDDLKIVATALQHAAQIFLTGDPSCRDLAVFAGIKECYLVRELLSRPARQEFIPFEPPPKDGNDQKEFFE